MAADVSDQIEVDQPFDIPPPTTDPFEPVMPPTCQDGLERKIGTSLNGGVVRARGRCSSRVVDIHDNVGDHVFGVWNALVKLYRLLDEGPRACGALKLLPEGRDSYHGMLEEQSKSTEFACVEQFWILVHEVLDGLNVIDHLALQASRRGHHRSPVSTLSGSQQQVAHLLPHQLRGLRRREPVQLVQ